MFCQIEPTSGDIYPQVELNNHTHTHTHTHTHSRTGDHIFRSVWV